MFRYHYRPVHAAIEALLARFTPRLRGGNPCPPLTRMPERILIVKFGGLGEAVLARALAEHLRCRHPALAIDVLVDERTREVMTFGAEARVSCYRPGVDGLGAALMTLHRIRRRRYGAAIDFEQTSLLTAAFLRASGIPARLGFAPPGDNPRRFFLTHPVELRATDSMWSAMTRLVRVLDPGLPEAVSPAPLPCGDAARRWVAGWWERNVGAGVGRAVAMHVGVGARGQYRRWPLGRFVELAENLRQIEPNVTVILTGDHDERPLIDQFKAAYSGRAVDASALGSVERTAALLERCDLLVANDTGVMHLGAAMGTPAAGVFGASNPAYWAPSGRRATYVYKTRMPCSPCIDSYRRLIPDECFAARKGGCMLDAGVGDVLEAARKVIIGGWLDGVSQGLPGRSRPEPGPAVMERASNRAAGS